MKAVFAFASIAALTFGSAQAEDVLRTPAIAGVVAAGVQVEVIKEGFQGTEGPIALPDGSVIFTEGQANRITRIAADGTTSTFVENSGGANGLAFNAAGELIAVQTALHGIGVVYPAEKARLLVDSYQGVPLNRPNDLVVDRKGGVYFTDPGARPEPGKPASKTAVYYYSSSGRLLKLAEDIERPNGIQLSPDEKTLYVANTGGEYILAYAIAADGSVGPRRNFAKLEGVRQTETGVTSGADGLAVDAKGRLYVASAAGIQVFSDAGQPLGIIPLPKSPQNLAFAGVDKKTLYVVGRGSAYRIPLLAQGFAGRAK